MSARLLVPPTATYEEWKAKRAELSRNAVTASEIAIILGISPWGSAFNLYWQKRGVIGGDFEDSAMSLGRHLEPWIADRWAEDHPEYAVSETGLWQSEERPWQMATPDRLAQHRDAREGDWRERDALLEIKSSAGYVGWGEDGTDEIPAHIRAQVLWQLDTLGLEVGHVTCWFKHTDSRRDYLVPFDEADVKLMRDAAVEFLGRVERGDPPPIDHLPATTWALKQLHPEMDEDAETEIGEAVAEDYAFTRQYLEQAKQRLKANENVIRDAMGPAKTAMCNGRKVATRSVYEMTGIDRDKLRRDFPDAYAACRTTTTVDKLVAARAKKEAS